MTDKEFYEALVAAKTGDSEAISKIMNVYAPYITSCAMRTVFDVYGNSYTFLDDQLRQRIESKLMIQLVFKFDPNYLPEGEVIED